MIKILIVDDNEDNLYLLESILDVQKFKTFAARNGKDALALALKDTPHLIVSDILMPVMDGYTFCRECKKEKTLKNIPFIFYTATYTDPKDEELAMHIGADRFILKPQEPEEFLKIIESVMDAAIKNEKIPDAEKSVPEKIVLKEYNEVLVRKLEDKMLQIEKTEYELRLYTGELEKEINERKKIEKSLLESEERFRSFYNDAVAGLYRITPEGGILLANKALLRMLGFSTLEEFSKWNLADERNKNSFNYRNFVEQLELHNEIKDVEDQWLSRDGQAIHVRQSAKAIRDTEGKTLYYDGIVEDISESIQVKDALEKSRHLFQILAQASPVGIFRTNETGYTTYVNPKWSELSGFSFEQAMGYGWLDAVHPDDRSRLRKNWQSDISSHDASAAEYRFLKPDGSIVWVLGNAVPEMTDSKIVGYIGTLTDITERKLYEQKLRFLSRAIEQSPVSVVLTDIEGTIQYVNPKFEEVTGYTFEETLHQNPRILKSGETTLDEYKKLWNTLLMGETWKGELHNKKKNGELYWEAASISPILDDKGIVTNFLAIKEDITERKQMLGELIAAKENAEEMNRLKSSFLANMSHELRTPMIGILGFSEILCESATGTDIIELAEIIYKSGKRLMETLNLILDLSRIEAGKLSLNLSSFNIIEEINDICTIYKPTAQRRNLYLNYNPSFEKHDVSLDKKVFREIINNLLNNAFKFTKEGGVTVEVSKESGAKGDSVVIKVKDTGIGISKENFNVIFEEFRQASEGIGRSFEGSGLGLTITKNFVEKLNGTISVESELNEGSTFILKFPDNFIPSKEQVIEQKIDAIPQTNYSAPVSHELPIVLYVEDEIVAFSVVSQMLKGICILENAATSKEALEKVEAKQYAVILMDINLKEGLDGAQTSTRVRTLKQYEKVPIVAVTAYAMVGDKEEFLAAGCSHYISKPFGKKEIIKLMNEVLSS